MKVAKVDRNTFKRMLGSLEMILERNAEKYKKFVKKWFNWIHFRYSNNNAWSLEVHSLIQTPKFELIGFSKSTRTKIKRKSTIGWSKRYSIWWFWRIKYDWVDYWCGWGLKFSNEWLKGTFCKCFFKTQKNESQKVN